MNNQAGRHADLSEGEDEELMFAFEDHDDNFSPRLHSGGSQIFHSIDGMEFERPANPLAAVLEHCAAKEAKKRGRDEDEGDEPEAQESADLFEEKLMPLPSNRKRKMFERPTVATTEVVRPTAKRYKSERSTTAPACLMGNLSLHRTSEPQQEIPDLANEVGNGPLRSASINIPHKFQPIHWPGDSAVVARSSGRERSHSCSSSSSSKSWASGLGLFCRRSLDVASPLRVHFNDMVLGTTASRAGSYTGS